MRKETFTIVLSVILSATTFGKNIEPLNNTNWKTVVSGNTELLLHLKFKGDRFEFVSREGSTKDILGPKYTIARLLGKVNSHTIEIKGKYHLINDTIFLKGNYESLTSTQDFSGFIINNTLNATMSNNKMNGNLINNNAPLRDYYSITKSAIDSTEQYLYNPAILKSNDWISFKEKVLALSKEVADDYEFTKIFNYNGVNLPFTHYGIVQPAPRKEVQEQTSQNTKQNKQPELFNIKQIDSKTILFTIKSFSASAEEITPYIDSLKTIAFDNLIIDLRDNSGGTIASALPLTKYLVNDTLLGGAFITQKYFLKHSELPKSNEYKNFPLFSKASFSLIIDGIHNQEGLCLIVSPDVNNYKGNLYILTNKKTASTCEPLVYGLKSSGRATIVGETTCGAMLNGEKFKLTNDFVLWVPTADYYTADGSKLDKIGVKPNVEVASEDALTKTLEILK